MWTWNFGPDISCVFRTGTILLVLRGVCKGAADVGHLMNLAGEEHSRAVGWCDCVREVSWASSLPSTNQPAIAVATQVAYW